MPETKKPAVKKQPAEKYLIWVTSLPTGLGYHNTRFDGPFKATDAAEKHATVVRQTTQAVTVNVTVEKLSAAVLRLATEKPNLHPADYERRMLSVEKLAVSKV